MESGKLPNVDGQLKVLESLNKKMWKYKDSKTIKYMIVIVKFKSCSFESTCTCTLKRGLLKDLTSVISECKRLECFK